MDLKLRTEGRIGSEQLFEGFENLMSFRVQDILLVSSIYDSFILREDGRLNELLIGDSLQLNLQHIPGITHVSSGKEAIALAKARPSLNLIVTNLRVADMDAAELAREVKAAGLDVPVVVLAYDYREVKNFVARNPFTNIERIFLWQGNVRILIAIVKYIEDKCNVAHDTRIMGVPVMLVVEDNIRYYSSFLPVIYTELITQSRSLISEGLNVAHKLLRMRARPKILLCSNYEEASDLVMRYRDNLLGMISDVEFPRRAELSPDAGFDLAHMVRKLVPDVPIVLQSSRTQFKQRADAEGFPFLQKRSPTLLLSLRRFLTEDVGFGDFVFRMPDGTEVARARDMKQLEEMLGKVPAESLAHHSERNHFSHWLMARTEFALAAKLRPRRVSDFANYEDLRRDIIRSIAEYRAEQNETLIGDFNPATFDSKENFFLRIGDGSLGGKARGLAFMRHMLHTRKITRKFPGIRISVPPTVVLTSDWFDKFLAENELLDFAIRCNDDAQIVRHFLAAALPDALQSKLRTFLQHIDYPLAVRSSSLLEDSQYQPFTGVYDTFMLANQHPDISVRLRQLTEAIKRIYASTFSRHAKAYMRATPYRLEEEKMAIVLQQVVGARHDSRFYPNFAGVVRSRNFYPVPPMNSEDGIASAVLGLGRAVVDGGRSLLFCPRYPRNVVQFSSVNDILQNSQTEFLALDLAASAAPFPTGSGAAPLAEGQGANSITNLGESPFPLKVAEADGTLQALGSTYSPDNQAVYDGLSRPGPRVVTFAFVLKHCTFPLAAILDQLMRLGEDALGRPVEIEWAVKLPQSDGETAEFGFLQMRPLVLSRESEELQIEDVDPKRLVCQSSMVLGNGRIEDLRDVVLVDFHRFERGRSQAVAETVARFNARLNSEGRPYLLIGVGRWGSNDPWLGIPVAWDQISGARAIVEAGFRDLRVTPSQGSHFFQNLTAFQVGYFTVNPDAGEGSVAWDWLVSQPSLAEENCVRHLRFDAPLLVIMNGRTSTGVIFKPE
jgi:CheY-like chemotaxis protein